MSTIQRHNTFGDTAMTYTHAQLQAIVDELRGRQKTAEDGPNDGRVNFAFGRAAPSNAIRFGGDRRVIDDAKQQYALVADEYNALVSQINALTAPFRAAAREQRNAAIRERHDTQQAQLRASACTVCFCCVQLSS
jgi:hypothetical protein